MSNSTTRKGGATYNNNEVDTEVKVRNHVQQYIHTIGAYLVLHDFDLHGDSLVVLQHLSSPDVHAHRGVELERIPSRRHLGVAVHDADLAAQLVEEQHRGAGLGQRARDLPEGFGHESGL
jgi:hypothetical protein